MTDRLDAGAGAKKWRRLLEFPTDRSLFLLAQDSGWAALDNCHCVSLHRANAGVQNMQS